MLDIKKNRAGLSIDQSGIRYVRLNKKTKGIVKRFFVPLEPGVMEDNQIRDLEVLKQQLKTAVAHEKIKGTEVFLTIPPSQMIIRKLSVPTTNKKQLDSFVQLEVETGLYLPFEHPVYDFIVTNTGDDLTEVLVFASPYDMIQTYVEVVQEAGLHVAGVEISGISLSRLITEGYNQNFAETMIIHQEDSYIDVYMFHQGYPVFMRTLSLDEVNEIHDGMAPLKLDEISAEISRMLNFYQYSLYDGEARINKIIITGHKQVRQILVHQLSNFLPEITVREETFDQLIDEMNPGSDANNYRLALGAALKPYGGFDIDLIPRIDKSVLFSRVSKIFIGVWVAGAMLLGTVYLLNHSKVNNQEQQLAILLEQNQSIEEELRSLSTLSKRQTEWEEAIQNIKTYRNSPVTMLRELRVNLPDGAVLKDVGYTYGSTIEISLTIPQMGQASEYLSSLRQMSFTKEAMIVSLVRLQTGTATAAQGNAQYTAVYQISLNTTASSLSTSTTELQEEVTYNGINE